jgi:hypothetical protein
MYTGAINMKSNRRFAVAITIAIVGMLIGLAATWFAGVNRGRSVEFQSLQMKSATTSELITDIADAHLLKGFNVYVCAENADQNKTLGLFVTQRGGKVQSELSQMNVDTDFVLLEANSGTYRFAEIVKEAKELHIPVADQSKLLRYAQKR